MAAEPTRDGKSGPQVSGEDVTATERDELERKATLVGFARGLGLPVTVLVDKHSPIVVGGPTVHGWECNCGKYSSQTWRSPFEAAYAAAVHVRNPDGPT